MHRFLSSIVFLAVLVVVLGAAGCGQRFDGERGNAPAAADLAADALAALEAKGSAHFLFDARSGLPTGYDPVELSLHLEGDASATALDAEGSVGFGAGSLSGRVLVGEHNFFLQVMGQWYGEREGLAEAFAEAKAEQEGRVWNELGTPEGLRRNFGELFTGDVSEGPVVDGVTTWQFEGRLDAEGVTDFAKRYGAEVTDRDEQMLDAVAPASRFILVAGQRDRLPRRLEFEVRLSADQLKEMKDLGDGPFGTVANFKATLELSAFGKPVEIEPPASFEPLDALFEQLFSGLE